MNINREIEEKAISWILKEKEGLNNTEKKDFDIWLKNKFNYNSYKKNKDFLDDCNNLSLKYKNILKEENIVSKETHKYYFSKLLIACTIFFIISFSVFYYYDSSKLLFKKSYHTQISNKRNINLPDNSYINLDVKSQLNINFYKNKRKVELLEGKAFFSIAKDKKRPFIITSGKVHIKVIGTKFEVINIDNINTINVIEGIVKVSYFFKNKIKTLLVLEKGNSLVLNNRGKVLKLENVNILDIAKWKDNKIKFNKTTLKDACEKFFRYSEKKVNFSDYDSSQLKISGIFSIKEFDKFIKALPLMYPLKVIENDDQIIIEKK